MGSFFSFISSIFWEENADNRAIEDVDRQYIAIDQSGSLGSLFDDRRDTIMGKCSINVQTRLTTANEPITCELYKGGTLETENLLDMVEIDCLLQLSILSKMILPNGIASIIDYSQPINEYTRFLYFSQRSFNESYYDESRVQGKTFNLSILETSATHVITEICWGIHFVAVLQLPASVADEIDQLLGQLRYSLIDNEYHLEMTSKEKRLSDQIISTTVYSNIPDLIQLSKLDDVYQMILRISKNSSAHRRLKYVLNPIQLLKPDYHGIIITNNQIEQVNRYLYYPLSQLKALKFHFDLELPKLPQDKLGEQLNRFRRDFSRLSELYVGDAQKIHRLIQCNRKGELIIHSIDQFFDSSAQIKDTIQTLIISLDALTSKGNFIKQLQDNRFEYYNVAGLGIEQGWDEQLVIDILFKDNRKKTILCSTDKLKQQSPNQWDALYSQITEEKQKNPQLILIYADFTYSTWSLENMVILSSKDQTISRCRSTSETDSSSLTTTEEFINILLIGESGVGKSTFINAFANYLQFNSLKEAQYGQPIVIIPVSFLITVNDNFDQELVKFGEPDLNENHNDIGQSVTQQCRSYVFEISPGKKLRIIDTPGFADTRGDSQDEINMNMIFTFMNNLTHLNGVCLLFKPNIARLNPFLYSIFTQIFQYFGENIRDHMIFCFTNGRSTFYAPGETRPLLKALFNSFPVKNIPFEKKNTFCFDSESFRYLVALQRSLTFSEVEQTDFEKSWIRSVNESQRLRSYLSTGLQPYRQNVEWQSIQNAQYQINFMIRPMLETIRNILRNILLYDMNCSIKLKATCLRRPTVICYKCDRIPKIFNQFWIFPDFIHHSQDECSSNEQTPTEYTLDYESLNNHVNDSADILNQEQTFLWQTCIKFAHVLQTNNARQHDPFLSGLTRMLNEEESIYQKQNKGIYNQQLAMKLRGIIEDYKQLLQQTQSNTEDEILPKIYELIRSVNEIPVIKEQINAIREYHHFLLTSNECNIDVHGTSLQ